MKPIKLTVYVSLFALAAVAIMSSWHLINIVPGGGITAGAIGGLCAAALMLFAKHILYRWNP